MFRFNSNEIYVCCEVGINHNGNLENIFRMMKKTKAIKADFIKFQKRDIKTQYDEKTLGLIRIGPYGTSITTKEQKELLELSKEEFDQINYWSNELKLPWTASPWDYTSLEFLLEYDIPFIKIASASITDTNLLRYCAITKKPLVISTGMADLTLIRKVVDFVLDEGGNIAYLLHCTSTYPTIDDEVNLLSISTLQQEFPNIKIGVSQHDTKVPTTAMAVALGAKFIERHVTLDRSMYGSDQSASLEFGGMRKVINDIKLWERVRGDGKIRMYPSEKPIAQKLRKTETL
ncbi:N-acetylneuraminate synthase [bacterium]|nr:N-acetylneuraminate synthase [bacterium]|tara:strand:- start:35 stop:901 length:867 start_codon:yes stop_codon:yes gene_type:complete